MEIILCKNLHRVAVPRDLRVEIEKRSLFPEPLGPHEFCKIATMSRLVGLRPALNLSLALDNMA